MIDYKYFLNKVEKGEKENYQLAKLGGAAMHWAQRIKYMQCVEWHPAAFMHRIVP